jgi:hypothetical protein
MLHFAPEPSAFALALVARFGLSHCEGKWVFLVQIKLAVTQALPAFDPRQLSATGLAVGRIVILDLMVNGFHC